MGAVTVSSRALTELMQNNVGRGQRLTIRAFVDRAVDPATGYRPSTGLIGKIIQGGNVQITPQLISAIAVGLEVPRAQVAEAAHAQHIGFEIVDPTAGAEEGVIVRAARSDDAPPSDLSKTRAWLERQSGDK